MESDKTDWFLLALPPINLYTANLLQPYWNGVEDMRIKGIVQPSYKERTIKICRGLQDMLDYHNAVTKKCKQQCKLDKSTNICQGCGRTIEEIVAAGIAAKSINNNERKKK